MRRDLKTGMLVVLCGLCGVAGYAVIPRKSSAPPRRTQGMKRVTLDTPRYKKMIEASKDDGGYYDSATERELRKRAEEGDAWAMRELRWPPGHQFHKLGRPYFKNNAPHPDGLFPHSGY